MKYFYFKLKNGKPTTRHRHTVESPKQKTTAVRAAGLRRPHPKLVSNAPARQYGSAQYARSVSCQGSGEVPAGREDTWGDRSGSEHSEEQKLSQGQIQTFPIQQHTPKQSPGYPRQQPSADLSHSNRTAPMNDSKSSQSMQAFDLSRSNREAQRG